MNEENKIETQPTVTPDTKPPVVTTAPAAQNSTGHLMMVLIAFGSGVLVMLAVISLYNGRSVLNWNSDNPVKDESVVSSSTPETQVLDKGEVVEPADTSSFKPETAEYPNTDFPAPAGQIYWSKKPVALDNLKLFGIEGADQDPSIIEGQKYYQLATFTSGEFKDLPLILAYVPCGGPCASDAFLFAMKGEKITIFKKYSSSYYEETHSANAALSNIDIPELNAPEFIFDSKGKRKLKKAPLSAFKTNLTFFNGTGLKEAFDSPQGGTVYYDPSRKGFKIKLPGNLEVEYFVSPEFVSENNIPDLTWNTGGKNGNEYKYKSVGGCGATNFADVVPASNNFVKTGTTVNGDAVYEILDENDAYLYKLYHEDYVALGNPDEKKITYQGFLKSHPVFFWKDEFGRTIRFTSVKFMAMAECAKPVIYLYPTSKTNVTVQIGDEITLSKSVPAYGDGWNVTAFPNGELVDKTGQSFPYLFWEGQAERYESPEAGYLIPRGELSIKLPELLSNFGLNSKEIADFTEYWLPLMQSKPFYHVRFYDTPVMNKLAPLKITPAPISVLRVFMDFKGLDSAEPIEAPKAPRKFERNEFTVVEWGGTGSR